MRHTRIFEGRLGILAPHESMEILVRLGKQYSSVHGTNVSDECNMVISETDQDVK